MPGERAELVPRVRIPETNGAVRTPTGDRRPIWTKRDAVDCKRMSGEFAELAPSAHIPEVDDAVLTSAGEDRPIWAK